ncbi:MAG: hypothetical protein K0R63_1451 [Rickettsiales bacterium]|jgi:hypothetical protein|nr:hypothetical protein [Rickettsiales bacterium]
MSKNSGTPPKKSTVEKIIHKVGLNKGEKEARQEAAHTKDQLAQEHQQRTAAEQAAENARIQLVLEQQQRIAAEQFAATKAAEAQQAVMATNQQNAGAFQYFATVAQQNATAAQQQAAIAQQKDAELHLSKIGQGTAIEVTREIVGENDRLTRENTNLKAENASLTILLKEAHEQIEALQKQLDSKVNAPTPVASPHALPAAQPYSASSNLPHYSTATNPFANQQSASSQQGYPSPYGSGNPDNYWMSRAPQPTSTAGRPSPSHSNGSATPPGYPPGYPSPGF